MSEDVRAVSAQAMVSEAVGMAQTEMAQTDDSELELAVREHARLVYRVAYSILRNYHDAEDAAQETFMRVLRYERKLQGVHDVRTWLARIAWRVAIGRRKKAVEIAWDEISDTAAQLRGSSVSTDQVVLGNEMNRFLEKVIAGLPGKLRDPLVLSTLEEMSAADIARVLGINEAAVRSRVFRARQILREKLTALLEGKHGI